MRIFDMPLELVILDVDGVILDLLACFEKNLSTAARRLGLPIGPITTYLKEFREGTERGYAILHEEGPQKLWPYIDDTRAREYISCFRKVEKENTYPLLPGSLPAIQWFRHYNVPIALCTTNDWETLDHKFNNVGLSFKHFAAFSISGNGYPTKPDPRALDPIFERIAVKRAHAVYVGDWYPDLETARGGDVRFVATLSGGIPRKGFLHAGVPEDHIIGSLFDLCELVSIL